MGCAATTSNGMKKILIVTGIFPPDIGGPASYAANIGPVLGKDYEIELITYSHVWRYDGDKKFGFKIARVWKKWPWFLRNLLYALKVIFSARKCDTILTLSTINGGLPALWAKRLFKKPVIVRIAGDYAWQVAAEKGLTNLGIDEFQTSKKTGRIGRLFRMQVKVCRQADLVIVPSEYLSGLVNGWGVDKNKIRVVYNGIDSLDSSLSKEDARNKIGVHGNIILSVGRLVPWKGFRMLIKIMPQLVAINQFFRLVIVGSGPDMEILKTMAANLGLGQKVFLAGAKTQEELKQFLAAADIFVLNTGYEGFSHQILEVMSAGVPVVTTNAGGNTEVIKQGENGFMIRYNDEFNLVEAVKTLWEDKDLQNQFVENGKKTAEKFKIEKMADETKQIFDKFLIPNS